MKVFVTGATGIIGREIVHQLAVKPEASEIRVGTRDPESDSARLLHAIDEDRVRPVRLTTGPEDLRDAFDGIDVLCFVTPLTDDMSGWQRQVLAEAGHVRRIVKVSVDAARPQSEGSVPGSPPYEHWVGEEIIRGMDVEHAFLRPTIFMQHFMLVAALYEKGDDTFYLPVGDGKMAMLDCRDIAYGVANLAVRPSSEMPEGPVFLTGPEALGGADIAGRLSLAARRQFHWNKDLSAFEDHAARLGAPSVISEVYQAGSDGAFADVRTEDYETAFGRRTTSFAKFALDYVDHFKS